MGYHGTTMAAVASRAHVAVQTVYFVFHTKAELLSQVVDAAVLGDDPRIPEDTDWFRAVFSEPDAAQALRGLVLGGGQIFQRAAVISEVARTAGQADPEAKKVSDHHEKLRRDGYRSMVAHLAEKAALRPGLDIDRATDILVNVFNSQTYLAFSQGSGWSHQEILTWWADVLPELLLDKNPTPE